MTLGYASRWASDAYGHITSATNRSIKLPTPLTSLSNVTSNTAVLGAKVVADSINNINSSIGKLPTRQMYYSGSKTKTGCPTNQWFVCENPIVYKGMNIVVLSSYTTSSVTKVGTNGLHGQYVSSHAGQDAATYVGLVHVVQDTTIQVVGMINGADTIFYYQVYIWSLGR